ncbi:MAG: YggS family pyridoxal phosphate-dependent enzyme [bacterium]
MLSLYKAAARLPHSTEAAVNALVKDILIAFRLENDYIVCFNSRYYVFSAVETISANLIHLRQRIQAAAERAGRRSEEINLAAISKTVSTELMLAAIQQGVRILGENRVQEARWKWQEIGAELHRCGCEFHLVGHLQSNKAKEAVRLFDLIHSLDSVKLAEELNWRAGEIGKTQRVLIEVNSSGEANKFGAPPEEIAQLVDYTRSLPNVHVEGLMTIGPLSGGMEAARIAFRLLHRLREECGGAVVLPELSMGMSQDFEAAIEEGATLIRVGTTIFGARV